MVSTEKATHTSSDLNKNVPDLTGTAQKVSNWCVTAEILRTFEIELIKKRRVPSTENAVFNPLWFLAETETNVFLWRKGLSIGEKGRFDFWINVHSLIAKRLHQFDAFKKGNPFLSPLLGGIAPDPESVQQETEYLLTFLENYKSIESHLHALSVVGHIMCEEIGSPRKPQIILPAFFVRH